jgi:hypothetical protein
MTMTATPSRWGNYSPMVHLRTVPDVFHARVIAARLGADGIVTELRGAVGGPYPMGSVSVWVSPADESIATDLLLADELEAAFEELPEGWETAGPGRAVLFGWSARRLLAALALLILVSAILAGRLLP